MVGLKGCMFTEQRLGRSNEHVKLRTMVGAVWIVDGVLGEEVGLDVG